MSDIESSSSAESITTQTETEEEADFGVVGGPIEPYRFEPLAAAEEPEQAAAQDKDEEGLTPYELERRKKDLIPVHMWCKCGKCDDELLSDVREFRCRREIQSIMSKVSFEGLDVNCILDHPDFGSLTNETVLEQVCPLIKDKGEEATNFPPEGPEIKRMRFYVPLVTGFL